MSDRHADDDLRLAQIHTALTRAASQANIRTVPSAVHALSVMTMANDLWEFHPGQDPRPRSQESTAEFLASLRDQPGGRYSWAFATAPISTTETTTTIAPPRRATAVELLEKANSEFQKKNAK